MRRGFGILAIILLAVGLTGPVSAEERQALQVGRFQIVTVRYTCQHDEGSSDSTQSVLLDTATGMTWSMDCLEGPKATKEGLGHRMWGPFEWRGEDGGGKRIIPLPPLYRYPQPHMKK